MLAVAGQDVNTSRSLLEEAWKAMLDDPENHPDVVIDFSQEEMTCPACLTKFKTGPRECPDCGLFLG